MLLAIFISVDLLGINMSFVVKLWLLRFDEVMFCIYSNFNFVNLRLNV
jgi:hypothetical protein